jgi:hypothetical protein
MANSDERTAIAVLALIDASDRKSMSLSQLGEALPALNRKALLRGIVLAQSAGGVAMTLAKDQQEIAVIAEDVKRALNAIHSGLVPAVPDLATR